MAVPGYQDFMLPLLKFAAHGQEFNISDAMGSLAAEMGISEEDKQLLLPSGTRTQYYNRVAWALMYLRKSLLLERTARGRFQIAPRGADVLKANVARIDNSFLSRFPEFQEFKNPRTNTASGPPKAGDIPPSLVDTETTPEERLEEAYEELRGALTDDLLAHVRTRSPKFFEHLVSRH